MNLQSRIKSQFLLFTLLLFLALPLAVQADSDPVNVLQQTLKTQQTSLEKLKSELENIKQSQPAKLSRLSSANLSKSDLAQAQLALELARMNVQSVQLDQSSTANQIEKFQSRITELQKQKNLIEKSTEKNTSENSQPLSTELQQLKSLLALKQQQLKLFNQRRKFLQQKVELSKQWLDSLQSIINQHRKAIRHETLVELEQKLQHEIQNKQNMINNLQHQLGTITSNTPDANKHQVKLTQQIHFLNESINLLNTKLKLAVDKAELEGIDITHLDQLTPDKLKQQLAILKNIRKQLISTMALTEGNSRILHQELELLYKRNQLQEIHVPAYRDGKERLQDLIQAFQEQLQSLKNLQDSLNSKSRAVETAYQLNLSRSLTVRQHLSADPEVWAALLSEINHLPDLLLQTLTASWHDLILGWHNAEFSTVSGFFLLLLLFIALTIALTWLPGPFIGPMADNQTFTMKTRDVFYALLRSSRPVLIIGAPIVAAAWVFNVESLHLIILFVVIWLTFQWISQISYWLFVSPLVPAEQRQPHLYHNILWIISGSAFFTLLVGMGHLGLLSDSMRALLDRLFMLLMLPLVFLTLQLRKIIIRHMKTDSSNAFWYCQ